MTKVNRFRSYSEDRTPEGKEGEALVSVVDGILTENGTAMSTTLLVSDL